MNVSGSSAAIALAALLSGCAGAGDVLSVTGSGLSAVAAYWAREAAQRPVLAPDCLVGKPPVTSGMRALPTADKATYERYLRLWERTCEGE